MSNNTDGNFNTANGAFALNFNSTGERNTAVGDSALNQNTEGNRNTATGNAALVVNTIGNANTAIGAAALFFNNASDNTAVGADALLANTTGDRNTASGVEALMSSTIGSANTAMGYQTLSSNTTGNLNTAIGHHALMSNTTEGGNTAVGGDSLTNYTGGGGGNTAIGDQALFASNTGSLNTALGFAAGANVTTASNTICINAEGENVSDSCYVGNIFGATSPGGIGVFVNANGKLGTVVSSRRFKHDIKPMEQSSEVIYRLNPVSFRYNAEIEPTRPLTFGLIAEDVEQVDPNLVARDKDGSPFSVRYDQVNAMLLNEFLKEHRTVKAQQKEIESLKQELKEQRALIEKVTARIETDKVGTQPVVDAL